MPTSFVFNGNSISEPGVYVQIKSGIAQPSVSLDYGRVVFIDTGSNAGWGGAGINSELGNSQDSVVSFTDLTSVKEFVRGGQLWKLAELLFQPNGFGSSGVSELILIKAATTTAPSITLVLTNGTFTVKCRQEGTGSNGVLASSNLATGFGVKIEPGTIDPAKFVFKFFRGTYAGTNEDGSSLTGLSQADSDPLLICQSTEVDTLEALVAWANTNVTFKTYFAIQTPSVTGAIEVAGGAPTSF